VSSRDSDVRAGDEKGGDVYRKILLAYDGASFSEAVLQQGAQLARLCAAELYLLGIVVTTGSMAIAESFGPSDVLEFEQRDLQRVVDAAVQDLQSQGLTVIACVRVGDPAAEIIEYAREVDAELIVLGHKSRGTLTRWLQGSVGATLLHDLPCSLLVATGSGDKPS